MAAAAACAWPHNRRVGGEAANPTVQRKNEQIVRSAAKSAYKSLHIPCRLFLFAYYKTVANNIFYMVRSLA
jgi:hypothetical protein